MPHDGFQALVVALSSNVDISSSTDATVPIPDVLNKDQSILTPTYTRMLVISHRNQSLIAVRPLDGKKAEDINPFLPRSL